MAIRRIDRTYTLTVTASAQGIDLRKALLAVPSSVKAGNTLRIMTVGSSNVWLKLGDNSVTATIPTTGTQVDGVIPMHANSVMDLAANEDTHISVIGESTGTTIHITLCDSDGGN